MANAVRVKNIVKQYDTVRAVDDVSYDIPAGSIFGLLGPNGAGKTTSIRMLLRIILPDSGEIELFGQPSTKVAKERVGYLPEERGLYKKMKVLDLLVFIGRLRSLSAVEARQRSTTWLERFDLANFAKSELDELSKGMQQKVQFIATVLNEPELLILDEPFSGLDPVNTNMLRDIILDYHRRGHTIIFSTHQMDQVEKLCQSICMINKGKVVLSGSLQDIKRQYGHGGVTLRFTGDGTFLADHPDVASMSNYGNEVFLRLHPDGDPNRVLTSAQERLSLTKFEVAEPTIHDIFVERAEATNR